jgi:hypothetical protein
MISALAWIPKGAARLEPLYVEIGEDDEEAIKAMQDLEENETVSWCNVAMHATLHTFNRRNLICLCAFCRNIRQS